MNNDSEYMEYKYRNKEGDHFFALTANMLDILSSSSCFVGCLGCFGAVGAGSKFSSKAPPLISRLFSVTLLPSACVVAGDESKPLLRLVTKP